MGFFRKPKVQGPTPAQEELSLLQADELRRTKAQLAQRKAALMRARRGRASLLKTSGGELGLPDTGG